MPTIPAASPPTSPNGPSSKTVATTGTDQAAAQDFDAFLQLMTAQLRNQNPLEPLDGTAFVAQLAQFSSVEQQIKTNSKLDDLLTSAYRSSADIALGYLGRTVESAHGRVVVTGREPIAFAYDLPAVVASAAAVVSDAAGNEVARLPLDGSRTGRQPASWTPVDAQGLPVADGPYTIEVVTFDAEGDAAGTVPALTRNTVREVRPAGQETQLVLDTGGQLTSADVLAVAD
ncbi:flagellar hook assembly protein FlgD [Marinivivus vitaminiproducens]|uniref:flagellar hook assembly protein FlgD n=1 Tax=Marinivivus vitaminiproducens TaxID=3035935 RepID=UPI0027A39167|nr:flagellar hook capping FlgD N-terminal domain-containing protein [Geminicoccaceae bacterium SCSIO 64248]